MNEEIHDAEPEIKVGWARVFGPYERENSGWRWMWAALAVAGALFVIVQGVLWFIQT